jgi:3'(2'), 5'-bisphosphate nucleotidase
MTHEPNAKAAEGGRLAQTRAAELLDAMVAAVRTAGAAIMKLYAGEVTARLKADRSPLTAADLASHRILAAALAGLSPALPVVSEEGGLPDHSVRAVWTAYWLIDPLDGTKEFLAGNGEFTVNVALIEHGQPTLGVVGVPARGQIFTGDVAAGLARRLDPDGQVSIRTA